MKPTVFKSTPGNLRNIHSLSLCCCRAQAVSVAGTSVPQSEPPQQAPPLAQLVQLQAQAKKPVPQPKPTAVPVPRAVPVETGDAPPLTRDVVRAAMMRLASDNRFIDMIVSEINKQQQL